MIPDPAFHFEDEISMVITCGLACFSSPHLLKILDKGVLPLMSVFLDSVASSPSHCTMKMSLLAFRYAFDWIPSSLPQVIQRMHQIKSLVCSSVAQVCIVQKLKISAFLSGNPWKDTHVRQAIHLKAVINLLATGVIFNCIPADPGHDQACLLHEWWINDSSQWNETCWQLFGKNSKSFGIKHFIPEWIPSIREHPLSTQRLLHSKQSVWWRYSPYCVVKCYDNSATQSATQRQALDIGRSSR